MKRARGSIRFGLLALALVALPLSACSSAAGLVGNSSFGNNKMQVAEIDGIGDYTADRALREARGHFRNSDFGHSAALYKRAVELDPKNAEGYVGLSASYDRLGRFDLSDRVYASLYGITGGTAQYYNNVGYSYMLRGNVSAALTNFKKAKAMDPENLVVANNIQILQNVAAANKA
jgi:Flp pilus assembly protein TadD